ncbi:MAG: hypothetical protein ACOY45_09940 [Pseudomonadota bacterium]
MTESRPGLDHPEYAAFAWARFRLVLWWMTGASVATVGVALALLWWSLGELRLHVAIATALGVFLTMMLASALMGLMFLSSGSGHDEQVIDPLAGEVDIDD